MNKTGAGIKLIGHADITGTAPGNLRLGNARGQAVKAYLVSKGVPARRIHTATQGDTNPVADNSTVQGRAQNRRVELAIK